jgi:hypothetical protein
MLTLPSSVRIYVAAEAVDCVAALTGWRRRHEASLGSC